MNLFPGTGLGGAPSGLLAFGFGEIAVQEPVGLDSTAIFRVYTPATNGQVFTIGKQPRERLVGVGMNLRRFMARGETLITGGIISDIADVGKLLRIDATIVYAVIQGGANGQTARLTFTGTGNKGSIVEGELNVVIKEV